MNAISLELVQQLHVKKMRLDHFRQRNLKEDARWPVGYFPSKLF